MIRKIFLMSSSLLLLLIFSTPTIAQDATEPEMRLLMLGVDVNGQGYPLVLLDLPAGNTETLATFASRPLCTPSVTPDGLLVLYELFSADGTPYVYQIDIERRSRALLTGDAQYPLNCPHISPDATEIAWYQRNQDDMVSLLLTDTLMGNETVLQVHHDILDIQWTPGGGGLVYQVVNSDSVFSELYSLPRQGSVSPRPVFRTTDGILHDFIWASDSTGLLVAYQTDSAVQIALLSTVCVIGPGSTCEIRPIATFPADASIDLLAAYAPLSRSIVAVVQVATSDGFSTDLWLIDLDSEIEPRQLTFSPDLIESDVVWSTDESSLYFIGSRFDENAQGLRGAVYYLNAVDESAEPVLIFESQIFSPLAFLHNYDLAVEE